MIAVALLDIERDLDVSLAAGTWLVSGYLVVMALAQPIGGRLGDALGHRRTFVAGLAGFLAISGLAALAPWFGALVALRMAQALAGGLMMPSAAALLRDIAPPDRRGRLFGWFGTVMGLAAAVGPVVGGVLVAGASWRAVFLVNLPVGAAALLLGAGASPRDGGAGSLRGMRFDVRGAAAFTGAVGGLVAALFLATQGVTRWVPALAAAVALLAVFVAVERRAREPFIALPLFGIRPYLGATATILLHNMVLYGLLLIVPVLAERELGLGPSGAGLLIGTMTGAMMVTSPVGGILSDRLGRRTPVLAGAAIAAAATAGLVTTSADPRTASVAALVGLAGVGVGIAGAALQTTAVESAPRDMVGVASGVFMTVRYTGGIAATGIAAAVASSDAFRTGFLVLTAAAVASIASAWALTGAPSRRRRRRDDPDVSSPSPPARPVAEAEGRRPAG